MPTSSIYPKCTGFSCPPTHNAAAAATVSVGADAAQAYATDANAAAV